MSEKTKTFKFALLAFHRHNGILVRELGATPCLIGTRGDCFFLQDFVAFARVDLESVFS